MFLRTEKTSRIKTGFVYAIHEVGSMRYKLGHGINVERRLAQLQTGNSTKLEIYAIRHFEDRYAAEKIIHDIFSGYRREGEWFTLDRQGKHLLDIIFNKEQPTEIERQRLNRLKIL